MKPPEYTDTLDAHGRRVTIRSMRPQDRDIEDSFVRGLSQRSRYYRFHSALKQLSARMLEKFTNVDYPDEMALIATVMDGDMEREIGVARYARIAGTDRAEVAVVVADDWQTQGIGTRLLTGLRDLAHDAGIRHVDVAVLPDNRPMLKLADRLGFRVKPGHDDYRTVELGKDIDEDL